MFGVSMRQEMEQRRGRIEPGALQRYVAAQVIARVKAARLDAGDQPVGIGSAGPFGEKPRLFSAEHRSKN
jgi:hypothetical protein